MREDWHGVVAFMVHGLIGLPLDLALAGIAVAWYLYIKRPDLPAKIATRLSGLYTLLMNNYYFDKFNDWCFAGGFRRVGNFFSNVGDRSIIDGFSSMAARVVAAASVLLRHLQTGRVYHYAFAMILSVFVLLTWFVTH
jgi:NADH-quinone oxidoreductase subunit L